MVTATSIAYKDIFDDYESVNVENLVRDIPTINSLEIISFFMAQLHTVERDQTLQVKILRIWIKRLPPWVHQRAYQFINRIEGSGSNASYLNNVSGLVLIEKILEYHNNLTVIDNLSSVQELNLFKAYLLCTQHWIDKQEMAFRNEKIIDADVLLRILLPSQIPYSELFEFKDFRIQFIKAIYFFRFCEEDDTFGQYLTAFLEEYGLKDWRKYLMNLLSLYVRKFEKLKTA